MSVNAAYPNPPITEAILDVRVAVASEGAHTALSDLCDQLGDEFPHRAPILTAIGQMEVGPQGGAASVQQVAVGWKLTSSDERQIAQAREDGFTFSRLAPYYGWSSFQSSARKAWRKYRRAVSPKSIERLAVRYINRIDVPGEQVELKDYFRTFPEIAPELPQHLDGFFVQVQLAIAPLKARCLINQTIVPPRRPGVVSFVLDVDLFRMDEVPQDEEAMWEYFERLREEKDRIFEACITDSSRELFHTCQP